MGPQATLRLLLKRRRPEFDNASDARTKLQLRLDGGLEAAQVVRQRHQVVLELACQRFSSEGCLPEV